MTPDRHDGGEPVRVVVVDDHAVAREGVGLMLANQPGIECVGAVGRVEELRDSGFQYDACVLDLVGVGTTEQMLRLIGDVAVVLFTQATSWRIRVGAWLCGARAVLGKDNSGHQLADAIWDAVHAPHLVKPQLAGALLDAVEECRLDVPGDLMAVLQAVRRGRRVGAVLATAGVSEGVYRAELDDLGRRLRVAGLAVLAASQLEDSSAPPDFGFLTPRQHAILDLIADGYSQREVSQRLLIAERTVTNQVRGALERFGITHNMSQDVWLIFALYVTGRHARPEMLRRRLDKLRSSS